MIETKTLFKLNNNIINGINFLQLYRGKNYMAKKGIGGVIMGSIVLFLGAIIITAGVGGRAAANTFLIEPMVGSTLQDIEDQAIPALEPAIKDMAYPLFLDGVHTQMQYAFGGDPANLAAFINGSTAAGAIFATANALHPSPPGPYADLNAALLGLFNDNILTLYGTPIPGISESMNAGSPIGYTLPMVGALCNGAGAPFVGILEQDPLGDGTPGILVFLGTYQAALADPPTMAAMLAAYGLPVQAMLDAVAGYITMILFPAVGALTSGGLGWNEIMPDATATTVGDYILAQWAQMALVPGGLGSLDPAATNFEVDSTFENLTQVKGVWNSLVGGDFLRWYAEDPTLETEFNLLPTTYDDIITCIGTVEPLVLAAVAGEYGLTYTTPADLYLRLFIGQWMRIGYLLDDPLFSMLGSPLVFELNFPYVYVLSSDDGLALWDQLKSEEGIKQWYAAVDDYYGPEYLALKAEHGLVDEQMNHITDYLETWRDETLFALNLQEEQIALPIWGYDLAAALDDLELYLPIAGGVFAVAGVLLIALFARKRA